MLNGSAPVITVPRALDHQLPPILSAARSKVIVCGRRWGKTILGLLAVLRGHGPSRGHWRGAIDGGKIWWIAPSGPVGRKIWRDLKRACKAGIAAGQFLKNEIERSIEFPGGGSVQVKSGWDPESLVGEGLDGVVIDEAAKVKPEVWYESIRASLADTGGWAIFIGTPKGHNWFFDLFQYAGNATGWERWQRPTSDNPVIPAEELEAARRDSPRYFGQEHLAHFAEAEGAEWPAAYFPPAIWFSEFPAHLRVTGLALDPAMGKGERGKGCFACYVYGGVDTAGVVWMEAWLSREWDAAELIRQGLGIYTGKKPLGWSVETNGGQEFLIPLIEAAAKEQKVFSVPLFAIHNHEEKEARIRAGIGPLLSRGRLRFRETPGTRLLVQQIRDFPVGEYVDGPDAAEMLLRLLGRLLRGNHDEPSGFVPVAA